MSHAAHPQSLSMPEHSLPALPSTDATGIEEGRWALPHGEFGLDVIALVGTLRYQQ
jgi:hypothetical protein